MTSTANSSGSSLPASASIVIIGAGIVGCSLAHSLARRGRGDIVVLDQGALPETGGSTSHAPGLMFSTSPSRAMTQLARRSIEIYSGLEHPEGPCYLPVGSIEVATTEARQRDLQRKLGWAHSWGNSGARLISPDEVLGQLPLIDAGQVPGALSVPGDGLAKAVRACDAMMNGVRAAGAGSFYPHATVLGMEVLGGRIRAVETSRGRIAADTVVICTGIWGPRIGRMAGISVPLIPVQHQYARTSPLVAFSGETREAVQPILRHQDARLYFRQHADCYGVGSYHHEPLLVEPDDIAEPGADEMPSMRRFTPEDFAAAWHEAQCLLPGLRDVTIEQPFNGMFSFTPDGYPLLGESRVRGLWTAEAVWVTHGGGVGELMAEWLCEGAPDFEIHEMDLHRFAPHAHAPAYVRARGAQQYREVYDIVHPDQQMLEPRLLRTGPFHSALKDLGGEFRESGGWERAHWFEANAGLAVPPIVGARDEWAARYWSPIIAAEASATRRAGAFFDMSALPKAEVRGRGALGFLQSLTTGNQDRAPGSVTYTLMLNERGGIRSDVTIARLDETTFQLGCNGPQDIEWLRHHAPEDGSVWIQDLTDSLCCIGVWGPLARAVMERASGEDWSNAALKYFRCRQAYIGEVPVVALRVSYVGELGYEIYAPVSYGARLWRLLWGAGRDFSFVAVGRGAFDSLRIEKGYRLWGTDMTAEHASDEAGLNFAVKPDKGEFLGRAALLRRREAGFSKSLRALTIDDGTVVLGKEPVRVNGEVAGYVTSADFGYNVGASMAYAHLPLELRSGDKVAVQYFGRELAATVVEEPLFDPRGERVRG